MAGERAGFNFWLNKLNQFNGNFVKAESLVSVCLVKFTTEAQRTPRRHRDFHTRSLPAGSQFYVISAAAHFPHLHPTGLM